MWLSTMIRVGRSLVFLNVLEAPRQHAPGRWRRHAKRHSSRRPGNAWRHPREASDVVALDGDVVVVVDPAEVDELQMAGQRAASPEMPSIMQPSPQSA